MNLDKQVCSPELAKKLKELGAKQESLFYWSFYDGGFSKDNPGIISVDEINDGFMEDLISAFTVAEIGEMLPSTVDSFAYEEDGERSYMCKLHPEGDWSQYIELLSGNTEAEVKAKMLIYLIENNLIKL